MERMLINATQPEEVRIAVTQNRQLIDLDIEQSAFKRKKSNIYKGVITSIEPSLGAVFVNYGAERHGFLPVKEISKEYFSREYLDKQKSHDLSSMDPNKILSVGQQLVVQIEKEERGTKGAALTTFMSLAGSFLVLMPNSPRAGGISRRIEGEDRDQLKETVKGIETPDGMGVIIRTACVGKTTEELNWDLQILLRYWEAIKQAAIVKPGPYLIHQESDVIIRSIRDYLRHDIQEIIIDEESAYKRALNYLEQIRPEFTNRLKLYTDALPIFSRFQIEQQIENAYQREAHLPSGGSIVIDHTEALVAIDVNSARATRGSSIEETAYNTNLEAAEEIAKQLRIRDLGGLIVIDFIDMLQTSHQRDVENRLRQSLRLDRARIQIGRISRFGLLEMSRQRLRSALVKNTQDACPRCYGRGLIRSVESLTLSVLHLIEEQAVKAGSAHLQVQLPVDVTTYLLNEKRGLLNEIQARTNVNVVIIPNHHLNSPAYQIKLIKDDHGKNTASYKQVKVPKAEPSSRKTTTKLEELDQPAINEFITTQAATGASPKKATSDGFLKKLWEVMFGGPEESATPASVKAKRKTTEATKTTSSSQRTAQTKNQTPRSASSKASSAEKNQPGSPARRGNRGGQQQRDISKRTTDSETTPRAKRQPNKTNKAPSRQPEKVTSQQRDKAAETKQPEKVTSQQRDKAAETKQPEKVTSQQRDKAAETKQPEKVASQQRDKAAETKQPEKVASQQRDKAAETKQPEKVASQQRDKAAETKQPEKVTSQQRDKAAETKQPEKVTSQQRDKAAETNPVKVIHNIEPSLDLTTAETTVFDHSKPEQADKETSRDSQASTTIPDYKKPELPAYQGMGSTTAESLMQQVTTKKKAPIENADPKDEGLISTPTTDKDSDE